MLKLCFVAVGLFLVSVAGKTETDIWRDAQGGGSAPSDAIAAKGGGTTASGGTSAAGGGTTASGGTIPAGSGVTSIVGQTLKTVLKLSCNFAKSPTECGFAEQAKMPGRASIVNIGRDGPTAVRLHTEPGDTNVAGSGTKERNDLWLSQAETGCYQGREQVWEHSILLPSDFVVPPSGFMIILQFHTTDNSGGQPNFAVSVLPNLTGLMWGYGGPTISRGEPQYPGRFSASTGAVTRNVWYDFVYHVKWSSGSDGFFHAWVNGVKKLSRRGPTLYAGIGCYLKLSNYHTAFGKPTSVIHDRIIRYDVQ